MVGLRPPRRIAVNRVVHGYPLAGWAVGQRHGDRLAAGLGRGEYIAGALALDLLDPAELVDHRVGEPALPQVADGLGGWFAQCGTAFRVQAAVACHPVWPARRLGSAAARRRRRCVPRRRNHRAQGERRSCGWWRPRGGWSCHCTSARRPRTVQARCARWPALRARSAAPGARAVATGIHCESYSFRPPAVGVDPLRALRWRLRGRPATQEHIPTV